jgi:hypothetical protein
MTRGAFILLNEFMDSIEMVAELVRILSRHLQELSL